MNQERQAAAERVDPVLLKERHLLTLHALTVVLVLLLDLLEMRLQRLHLQLVLRGQRVELGASLLLRLAAVDGVVRFLEEKGVGLDMGVARIPLVSAAVLFDVVVGDPSVRPDAAMGYEAASSATSGDFAQGSVGAGTGATVGKVLGMDRAMKGGLGSASAHLAGGLVVGALAAVNAFGEVRDPRTRKVLAGPRLEDGTLGDTVELLPEAAARLRWGESTTLGIVATNARLSKPQVSKVAQMGHDGLARAVYPVHTTVDGDVVFAASTGRVEAAPDVVGAWGARVEARCT